MIDEPALFPRLVQAAEANWRAYTRHDFVLLLATGNLPESCFRRYLVQDYLFLIHFARAWGLAIYKSDTLSEMRRAQRLSRRRSMSRSGYTSTIVAAGAFRNQ